MYIDKLIDKFGLTDALPVATPSDVNVTLMKNWGQAAGYQPRPQAGG